MISTFTAFFDANVFYGARLRSLVVELAQTGLFRARWSEEIHQEWISNLLKNRPDLKAVDLEKTRRQMDSAVLDCLVSGYESLVPCLALPDADDRHVLAAAILGKASVIVTFNVADFPDKELSKYGIHVRHADDFLLDVESVDSESFIEAVSRDLHHYKAPPLSVDDYISSLERAGLPKAAVFLRARKVMLEASIDDC